MAIEFNPFDPSVRVDPYAIYARLREESPVYFNEALRFWMVTRYDDVFAVARNYDDFSSAMGFGGMTRQGQEGDERPEFKTMISTDPPDHGRLRGLVARAFTPRMIAAMEPRIRQLANELIDEAQAKDKGSIDLAQQLAIPLPVMVIAEILGVPITMRDTFKRWSDELVLAASGGGMMSGGSMKQFYDYFRTVVEERRKEPREDMITTLVQAADGEGQRLTEQEVLAFCLLLLVAGNETTTNLIGNGTYWMLNNPDQYELVRKDPSLVPSLVEEALRYDGPVQGLFRGTKRDMDVSGTTIPQRNLVMVMYAAADRDPEHFPDPDRFDITRTPNDHVAFGTGIHSCLGAPLARLEAKVAFETILERMPNARLEPGENRVPSFLVRGFDHLPLSYGAN